MPKEKNYQIRKFSTNRKILADYNDVAASYNRVTGLVEIDITDALTKITDIEKKTGYKVSMTAWVAKCVSQAVKENMQFNSYRKGRSKIIVFDNVDISVIIELNITPEKKIPFNYVIRKVEAKSVKTITDEIRTVQNKKISEKDQLTRDTTPYMFFYSFLPRWFRRFVIDKMLRNPFNLNKLIGTVGITSLGMFVKGQGGWAIPFADKTLNIALGGIKDSVILRDGKVEERKLLCTTFLIDHNIVDGAPAARFISQLTAIMGDTIYLNDLEKI